MSKTKPSEMDLWGLTHTKGKAQKHEKEIGAIHNSCSKQTESAERGSLKYCILNINAEITGLQG